MLHSGNVLVAVPTPLKGVVPVRVAALVSAEGSSLLGPTVGRRLAIQFYSSASQIVHTVVAGLADVVMIDPTSLRPDSLNRIVEVVDSAGRGLVFYLRLTAEAARLVLETTLKLRVECVFHGPCEDSALVIHRVCNVATPSMPSLVLEHVAQAMAALPPILAMQVVGLFGWLPVPHRVSEFAETSRIERRSMERYLLAAGLAGPSRLLACARLTRSWHDLQDHHLSITTVAERSGFPSVRTFVDQYHRLLGEPPSAFRSRYAPHDFALRIASALHSSELSHPVQSA